MNYKYAGHKCHDCGTEWNEHLAFRDVRSTPTEPTVVLCEVCYTKYLAPLLKYDHYRNKNDMLQNMITNLGNLLLTEIRKK